MNMLIDGAMTRRTALAALGSAVAAPALARGGIPANARPNILYIMADDMGHADLGCYGSRNARTPAIDSLAARGVKFANAYANSCVCSPTRIALLTGRYQGRFRIGLEEPIAFNGGELSLPRGTTTLPGLLKGLGYDTSLVGKWHIGELPASSPLDYGYDYFFGTPSGGTDYFAHATTINGHEMGKLFENRTEVERHGYLTDLLGEKAIERVRHSAQQHRPFFVSLHFTAPHWPWEGPEDADVGSTTADPRQMERGNIHTYAAMMESMDANVGRLLAEVARLGLEENTIVVFTSDNGGERFSDSWPLTGMKGELLEGGIRVPLIVSWPAQLPKQADSRQVTMSMDALPTLFSAAGGDPSKVDGLDGIDLMPFLHDVDRTVDRTLFWRHRAGDQIAVRSGQWKYLRAYGRDYLFDLADDERERADKQAAMPEKVSAMKAAHAGWLAQMLPYPAQSYSEDMLGKFADRPKE